MKSVMVTVQPPVTIPTRAPRTLSMGQRPPAMRFAPTLRSQLAQVEMAVVLRGAIALTTTTVSLSVKIIWLRLARFATETAKRPAKITMPVPLIPRPEAQPPVIFSVRIAQSLAASTAMAAAPLGVTPFPTTTAKRCVEITC